jgi:hypothetical protein
LGFICLGLLWHLWKGTGPRIEGLSIRRGAEGRLRPEERERLAALCVRRRILWLSLLALGSLTLFCAALLRYMS